MDRPSSAGSAVTGNPPKSGRAQTDTRAGATQADGEPAPERSPAESIGPDAEGASNGALLPVPYAPPRRSVLWHWFRNLFGVSAREDLRESLAGALDQGHGEADALTDKERIMLRNVLELRNVRVEDVMVPRADINAVDLSMPLVEIIRIFQDAGHSRLPVTRESLDDPVGLVHIKDVMTHITAKATQRRRKADAKANAKPVTKSAAPASAKNGVKTGSAAEMHSRMSIDLSRVDLSVPLKSTKLLREVLYVPPSMPAGDLLVKMQADRMHMAIVVDEYGGTDGLVTIEDLVEEIVGDISDEHDDEEAALIAATGGGSFVADARAAIEDVMAKLGAGFEPDAEALEEIDTLGGLLFSHVGRVPVRGEIVNLPGSFEFEVIDADPRRVKRVRISPRRVAPSPRKGRSAVRVKDAQPTKTPGAGETPS